MLKRVFALLLSCFIRLDSLAAETKIDWLEPENYTDIDPSNESRRVFKERVFEQFETIFSELAQALPEDVTWHIQVTDVDLAGLVIPNTNTGLGIPNRDIRLIRQEDLPRMSFNYTITGPDNTIVIEDKVSIKQLSYLDQHVRRANKSSFQHEQNMLERWFEMELLPKLAAHSNAPGK